jgi:hypothetical protein
MYQDRVRRQMAQDHPDFAACEAPGGELEQRERLARQRTKSAQIIGG